MRIIKGIYGGGAGGGRGHGHERGQDTGQGKKDQSRTGGGRGQRRGAHIFHDVLPITTWFRLNAVVSFKTSWLIIFMFSQFDNKTVFS